MYDCNCEKCKAEKINLSADSKDPIFKKVLKAAENAFKFMHEKGGYKAEDINEKPYQKLINETYKTFDSAVTSNDIPPEMLAKLQNDTFIFSGLRTHAQLLEASSMLTDDKGQIRNFDSFANEFNQVNRKYNQNYLEAEWQFAVNSSQSAANWAAIDSTGRYNLQYRTANDDRVRADHAALQNITLPVEDSFWLSYYPPNGWRCRCTAVEVLKTKYELSDSTKANELGNLATTKIGPDGKNRMEIFRFNPGMENKVFPPKHPYNKVEGANKVKEKLNPFELNDDTIEKLKKKNIYFEFETGQNFNEQFKGFDILKLDSEMSNIAKKRGIEFDVKKYVFEKNNFYFEYSDSNSGFVLIRDFKVNSLNEKIVEHSYFKVPKDKQGDGISKEIFQSLYKQYRNAGINKIEVHANIDVGGYTWAKYGFNPTRPATSKTLKYDMDNLLSSKAVTKDEHEHFMNLYNLFQEGKTNNFNINKVANSTYGKKLLLGTDWRGEIDLRIEDQRKIFEDYLFGR